VIKTILFDLGNTIVPFDFQRAYSRLQPLCNYPVTQVRERLRSTDLISRFETGRITSREFVREFASVLEMNIDYDEFCSIWTCVFLPEPLIDEALVADLAEHHRLMILSNTNPIHFHMIQDSYPLLRHFHHAVLSYEVGEVKPHARIFEEAIARAGCRAEECFFTDDLVVNVEAAREHKMDAVLFESAAKLKGELKMRGVL
jgi:putative hydrolase of the HAD superfamily